MTFDSTNYLASYKFDQSEPIHHESKKIKKDERTDLLLQKNVCGKLRL